MGLLIAAQQFRYAKVWPDQAFDDELQGRRGLIEVGHSWGHFTDRDSEWIRTSSFVVFIVGVPNVGILSIRRFAFAILLIAVALIAVFLVDRAR